MMVMNKKVKLIDCLSFFLLSVIEEDTFGNSLQIKSMVIYNCYFYYCCLKQEIIIIPGQIQKHITSNSSSSCDSTEDCL